MAWQTDFKLAVIFLTRIPLKLAEQPDDVSLNRASGYFALVGVMLGLILAISYWLLQLLFPATIAVVLLLAVSLLLTGAFHEDGFADVWDGFGGGFSTEHKLQIMKDSRLGTYGAAALVLLLLLKVLLLASLSAAFWQIAVALLLGHSLSRAMATSIIGALPYVQEDAQSKVKPVAEVLAANSRDLLNLTSAALILLLWLVTPMQLAELLVIVVVLWLLRALCLRWFKQQLGGYTGDCLGAAQQLAELSVYACLVVLWQ
ncbi:adenosylcobinamide-GDP ribazoletransferase [Pseudoalteromonas fenneropenaei]|uniref:Adenosylcobinamide-GDP ribazoletransferase n=1 Tax=Pseudoalteromonas fenneropenaei TaxID=1737459 RepID=A0ABV7CLD0_9GAMM